MIGYTHAQALAAEAWIIKGNPMRYGQLSFADFFPSREQLAEVSHDISVELRNEYARGYGAGFVAGQVEADKLWQQQ